MATSSIVKFDPEAIEIICMIRFVGLLIHSIMNMMKWPKIPQKLLTQAARIEQNKRKIFFRRFASRNLQKDYEDVVQPESCSTMTFTQMVTIKKSL